MSRKNRATISNILSVGRYFVWMIVAFILIKSVTCVIYQTYDLDNQINDTAIHWLEGSPESIVQRGLFFSRNEECVFTGYHPDGTLIKGTAEEPQTILPPYMKKEIGVDGNRYIFTMVGSEIVKTVVISGLTALLTIFILMHHIRKVTRANFIISTKFYAAKKILGDCANDLDELVNQKSLRKKYLNIPLCVLVPIIVIMLNCLSINLAIEKHGRVVTETISNVVRHYSVLQDDKLIDSMDQIDKIQIDIIDISDWRESENCPLSEDAISAIKSTQGDYVVQDKIAHNYKLLENDLVIDISVDLSGYYIIIYSYILTLSVYAIYLVFKFNENVFIDKP